MAFVSFRDEIAGNRSGAFVRARPSEEDITSARTTIARLENLSPEEIDSPSDSEVEDWTKQLQRLVQFFRGSSKGAIIEPSPRFVGCGIIDTCYGDVYFDGTLFEVKAGQRSFRSVDIRQILIYAALNMASNERRLENVGLFNPRTGLSFLIGLNELCLEVAGLTAQDLLTDLIRLVSSGDVSR